MKKLLTILLSCFLLSGLAINVYGSGSTEGLEEVDIDIDDSDSLRRGAHVFVNYCLSCHSANFMRYNRMAEDLGISEQVVVDNMMFASDKIGEKMTINMDATEAKTWFGVTPPDLTVIARARGADWLYTYLKSFYVDDSSVTGWNNTVFDRVAMPNPLYELQGMQSVEPAGEGEKVLQLVSDPKARMKPDEFNSLVRDLTNYLVYMGEPAQLKRRAMGGYVLFFLLILTVLMVLLKKDYWKDLKK